MVVGGDEDGSGSRIDSAKRLFSDVAGLDDDIDEYTYVYSQRECIEHLFRVASSLDSLVVGESQILSQVKNAYSIARRCKSVGTVINQLFNRAIAVGKRVRTETRIAYNAVSVSYAAVELAKQLFADLSASTVMLLGAGKMSELTAEHLVSGGVQYVMVANRHYDRAAELAKRFGGRAVPFESAMDYALGADIIITSTGAPHYIIKKWETEQLMRRRKGRPIFFIDIAVPRDVEPDVSLIEGVTLYNIDDLESVVDSNIKMREQEAEEAEVIVQEETDQLIAKFQYLSLRPVMESLHDKAEDIRLRAVKRAYAKMPNLTEHERRIIKNMTKIIVRKLLREPMRQVNRSAGTTEEQYFIDAMCALFKLEVNVELGENEANEK
jgi:glutamyl-tRNA reductase